MKDSLAQDSAGLNIRGKMFADDYSVPAYVAANLEDGVLMSRKQFSNHHGINGPACGMPAGIRKTGLRFALGQALVELIRAKPFEMVLGIVDQLADLLLHFLQQGVGFRKYNKVKGRTDGLPEDRE